MSHVIAQTHNPSTQETEARGSPKVRGQPGLHRKVKVGQGYIGRRSKKIIMEAFREGSLSQDCSTELGIDINALCVF